MQLLSTRASSLTDRAMRAYFRSCQRDGTLPLQPSSSPQTHRSEAGRTYVALTNCNGLLAAFSLRKSGRLHRLTRVPAAITAGDETAYLLRNPRGAKRLLESVRQLRASSAGPGVAR